MPHSLNIIYFVPSLRVILDHVDFVAKLKVTSSLLEPSRVFRSHPESSRDIQKHSKSFKVIQSHSRSSRATKSHPVSIRVTLRHPESMQQNVDHRSRKGTLVLQCVPYSKYHSYFDEIRTTPLELGTLTVSYQIQESIKDPDFL